MTVLKITMLCILGVGTLMTLLPTTEVGAQVVLGLLSGL